VSHHYSHPYAIIYTFSISDGHSNSITVAETVQHAVSGSFCDGLADAEPLHSDS